MTAPIDYLEQVRKQLHPDYLADAKAELAATRQQMTPEDSYLATLGKGAVSGAVGLAANMGKAANFAQRIFSRVLDPFNTTKNFRQELGMPETQPVIPKTILESMDTFAQDVAPNTGDNIGKQITAIAGNLLGTGLPIAKGYSIAEGASVLAGKEFAKYAPKLSQQILSRVARTAQMVETGVGGKLGKVAGNIVANAPKEIVAGLGTTAAFFPEELASPKGIGIAAGTSLLGGMFNATRPAAQAARPEVESILKNVAMTPEYPALDPFKDATIKAATEIFDRTLPLKAFEESLTKQKVNMASSKSIYGAQQMTNGSGGMADNFLFSGRVPKMQLPDGQVVSVREGAKPLEDIFKPLTTVEDQKEIRAYLISKRALDPRFANSKIETGVDFDTARKTVDGASDRIKAVADEVFQWTKDVREYAIALGQLDRATAEKWDITNPNYVSFFRSIEKHLDPEFISSFMSSSSNSAFKFMKGVRGEKQPKILDPIENLKTLAHIMVRSADRNFVGQRILNIAKQSPEQAEALGLKILSASDKFHTAKFQAVVDDIFKVAQEEGNFLVDKSQAAKFAAQFGKAFDPTDNVITVYQDGVVHRLQLSDDLAKVYKSSSPTDLNWLMELGGFSKKALQIGVTHNPAWQAMTALKDMWTGTLRSQHGFVFGLDNVKGFYEYMTNPEIRSTLARGLSGESSLKGGFHDVNNPYRSLLPRSAREKVTDVFAHPLLTLRHFLQPFEEAARMGEGMRALKNGLNAADGSLAMRNLTNDYKQMGASMGSLSRMTAFLNPGIQSVRNDFKTLKNNPKHAFMTGIASITLPSISLWYANKDDPEIQELRKRPGGQDKWYVRSPFGEKPILQLDKPWFFGHFFGTTMENTLDALLDKDPEALERTVGGYVKSMGVNAIPTFLNQIYQINTNEDSFGNPIVSRGLEDVEAQFRVNAGTTEIAKQLSGLVQGAIDPIQVDFIIRNTFGSVGKEVTETLNHVLRTNGIQPPAPEAADMPFFGRFFARQGVTNTQSVRTFYKNADRVNEVIKTAAALQAREMLDERDAYIDANIDLWEAGKTFSSMQKELKNIRETINQIQREGHTSITPQEKRRQLNYYAKVLVETAREFNEATNDTFGF